MRLRALLGGWLLLSAVALWHRSSLIRSSAGHADGYACPSAGGAQLCAAVAGLATALRNPILQMDGSALPPPETPVTINPASTRATIATTVRRPVRARAVRQSYAVVAPLKRRPLNHQYPDERMAGDKLDHAVPTQVGALFDRRDLWLLAKRDPTNAAD